MIQAHTDPMQPDPWRITRFQRETEDTFTVALSPVDPELPVPGFLPGQFNMLYLFGVGEIPISICGDPARPQTLRHTTREVGTVTRAMHKLRKGGVLGVRGPYGSSWPLEAARGRDVVFMAGGIGLAPLRPAILHALAHREEFRRLVLVYGARSPADILYPKELAAWQAGEGLEVFVTVDRASRDWKGDVGVAPPLIKRIPLEAPNALAMICGPEIMMRAAIQELQLRGISTSDIYLSMERNMKCAIGLCGHCQYGASFICKDGPVFP